MERGSRLLHVKKAIEKIEMVKEDRFVWSQIWRVPFAVSESRRSRIPLGYKETGSLNWPESWYPGITSAPLAFRCLVKDCKFFAVAKSQKESSWQLQPLRCMLHSRTPLRTEICPRVLETILSEALL
eukprot:TRINITY_DN928_c0_g2_i1.p1 TRINITY_DN928_c0_g2~~TRINITY_DN928_c0_g2_i1.p1  ORF type:complete len:127 (-),score=3.00 TRINITY_DN928_c0_g2_i1:69-449(-)